MTEENRCCTCTTPEITIKLNKQGPQGLTGPQGEPGFSPVINVAENTNESYKLNITTIDGSYQTPNLKGVLPEGGVAGDVLTKNSSVNGDVSFLPLPFATETSAGMVELATLNNVLSGYEGTVLDGYRFQQALIYSGINGGNAQTNNYDDGQGDTDTDNDTDTDTDADTDTDTDTDVDSDTDIDIDTDTDVDTDTDTDDDLGGI